MTSSAALEPRSVSQATFTVTPDIPSLSDIAELDENSTADPPVGDETVRKVDSDLAAKPQVRRETFDATQAKQIPSSVALLISPPKAAKEVSQLPALEAPRSGVVLDISPPARPATAARPQPSLAKAVVERRSVLPSSRNVVASADFTTPIQAAGTRGIDRYRARSSVAARVVPGHASQSASQSKGDRPSPTNASIDAQPSVRSTVPKSDDKKVARKVVESSQPGNESAASVTVADKKRASVSHFRRPGAAMSVAAKPPVSRLSLVKPAKNAAAIIHHPNPYAARNMYYDERWIEKQENGFKKWLNFVLTPPDGFECSENDRVLLGPGKLDVAKLWSACTRDVKVPRAPTREVLSMRAYSVQRQLKRLRRDAAMLWQSPAIAPVSPNDLYYNLILLATFHILEGFSKFNYAPMPLYP